MQRNNKTITKAALQVVKLLLIQRKLLNRSKSNNHRKRRKKDQLFQIYQNLILEWVKLLKLKRIQIQRKSIWKKLILEMEKLEKFLVDYRSITLRNKCRTLWLLLFATLNQRRLQEM